MSQASWGPSLEDGDHLGETVPVVLAQLLEPCVQVVEAVLVRRQDLLDLVGLELVERRQVVTQRVRSGLGVDTGCWA